MHLLPASAVVLTVLWHFVFPKLTDICLSLTDAMLLHVQNLQESNPHLQTIAVDSIFVLAFLILFLLTVLSWWSGQFPPCFMLSFWLQIIRTFSFIHILVFPSGWIYLLDSVRLMDWWKHLTGWCEEDSKIIKKEKYGAGLHVWLHKLKPCINIIIN